MTERVQATDQEDPFVSQIKSAKRKDRAVLMRLLGSMEPERGVSQLIKIAKVVWLKIGYGL